MTEPVYFSRKALAETGPTRAFEVSAWDFTRYVAGREAERREAQATFLAASIAVWREIDRLDSRPEGYHPTDMDVELRRRERAAWERYRETLEATDD